MPSVVSPRSIYFNIMRKLCIELQSKLPHLEIKYEGGMIFVREKILIECAGSLICQLYFKISTNIDNKIISLAPAIWTLETIDMNIEDAKDFDIDKIVQKIKDWEALHFSNNIEFEKKINKG